jgi:hypothetical protein
MPAGRTRLALGFLLLLSASALGAPPDPIRLLDLDDHAADPFQSPAATRAIVFVFTSTDCPISNRYAPEVRRLNDEFAPKGVVFRLVYPNPADSADAIRRHMGDYAYRMDAYRDPRHDLVKLSQATVTPEAAVFTRGQRLVYRGRIDDRYAGLGIERPAPGRHDLEDALKSILAGKAPSQAVTQAFGCFIADFAR